MCVSVKVCRFYLGHKFIFSDQLVLSVEKSDDEILNIERNFNYKRFMLKTLNVQLLSTKTSKRITKACRWLALLYEGYTFVIPLLYLSSVKVCHVAGRRDAGSESLWLMYDPPMCCISGAIFPLNEFTVVHDTASTGKAFQLLTTLWLKEYLRQSRRAPFPCVAECFAHCRTTTK